MSEKTMRKHLIKVLRKLDAKSIESPMQPGIPDMNYVGGWIELKWLKEWPKRPETMVAMDHFTREQRVWLRRRARAGGVVWVMLQVGREWMLFQGDHAARYLGVVPYEGLKKLATLYFSDGLDGKALLALLKNN